MRYEPVKNIVRLAVRLQGTAGGLTLNDIQADFSVSRSTAERMRDAVSDVFGGLERVNSGDAKHHWRLRSDAVRRLVAITPEELAELESAASAVERAGLDERATTLREFATKVRATLRTDLLARIESELEALILAAGLAPRAGPRPRLDAGLLAGLREAFTISHYVVFNSPAQSTGQQSLQLDRPMGLFPATARSSSRRTTGRRSSGCGATPNKSARTKAGTCAGETRGIQLKRVCPGLSNRPACPNTKNESPNKCSPNRIDGRAAVHSVE